MGRTKGLHHSDTSGWFYAMREALDTLREQPTGRHHRSNNARSLIRDIRKTIALAVMPSLYAMFAVRSTGVRLG